MPVGGSNAPEAQSDERVRPKDQGIGSIPIRGS